MTSWPVTTPDHLAAVARVMERGVYAEGPEARWLEDEFASYSGRRYAVSVSSGTAAIELALAAAEIGHQSNVGIPSYTFAGSALGALRVGADIVWTDVSEDTFLAEEADWLAVGPLDAAIVVHLFGQAAPIPTGCVVIEDCAQAFGTEGPAGPVGRSGLVSCWSLNASKTVWAGEGGMLATDDEGLADTARMLRDYGGLWEVFDPRSYNWKLSELGAALARASLLHLDGWVNAARDAALAMDERLQGHPVFITPKVGPGRKHVYHQYRVMCQGDIPASLFEQVDLPVFPWQYLPLPAVPAFGSQDAGLWPHAEAVGKRSFSLGGDDVLPPCVWTSEQVDHWANVAWRMFT